MQSITIGIDVGRHSAVAVLVDGECTVTKVDASDVANINKAIVDIALMYGNSNIQICVERPFCNGPQRTSDVQKLAFTFGTWIGMLYSALPQAKLGTVTPSVWTNKLLLNGMSKADRVTWAKEQYGLLKCSHDEADAIGIATFAARYPQLIKGVSWYA